MSLCSAELLLWFHLVLVVELCGQFLAPAMTSAVLLGASSHSSPCAPCPIPRKRGFCGLLLSPPQTAFPSPPRQLSNPPKMVTASLAEVLWTPQLSLPQAFCLPEVLLTLVVLVVPKVLQLLAGLCRCCWRSRRRAILSFRTLLALCISWMSFSNCVTFFFTRTLRYFFIFGPSCSWGSSLSTSS